MFKNNLFKIIIAVSIILTVFIGCQKKEDKNKLYVGTNAEFEPFEYREGDNIVGFDIDLINEIVHRLEEKTLSVFLGAGMSYDACCLDWTTLIKPYAEQLDTEVKDPIDALQYYQTSKGVEPVALKKEISDNFLGLKGDIRHQILSKLPIRNYWTTNFDTIMEDSITEVNFKRDIIISSKLYKD